MNQSPVSQYHVMFFYCFTLVILVALITSFTYLHFMAIGNCKNHFVTSFKALNCFLCCYYFNAFHFPFKHLPNLQYGNLFIYLMIINKTKKIKKIYNLDYPNRFVCRSTQKTIPLLKKCKTCYCFLVLLYI